MQNIARTSLRLLFQCILGISFFISTGYVSSAEAAVTSYNLFANVSGKGKVTRSPSAIRYASGTKVTLTASPTAGNVFSGWSGGGCSGSTPTCTVTMTATTTVTATFAAAAVPKPDVPTLSTPVANASNVSQKGVKFSWSVANAKLSKPSQHRILISQDPNFGDFVDNSSGGSCPTNTCFTKTTGTATSYSKNMDFAGTTYYWKVRANGAGGASDWSQVRKFTTAGSAVSTYAQSIWNEANRAYKNGERTAYKGADLVSGKYTYCARHVRLVHGKSGGYLNAVAMCKNYSDKGLIKSGKPPVGAAVCYTGAAPGTGGDGHIAIADGNGKELGVTSSKSGVELRTSLTNKSYYWGWVSADDFKNNY